MAKSGTASSVVGKDSSRSAGTRTKLIDAAIGTLKEEGFSGASARAIAERAGLNQGLIFYHFGSVPNLLLAGLDSVSARRMGRYGEAVDRVGSPTELVDVATAIFREDLDAGYVAVLVEMIAGASSTPGLGSEVSNRR
jgi:AcrR family transcriptional regulator